MVAYTACSSIMTLVVPYYELDDRAGLVQVWGQLGYPVVQWVVSFGAIAALLASMFGSMFPMPRIAYAMAKGGLISEIFSHSGSNLPKKGAKSLSEHLTFWWIVLKDMFWPLFWGFLSQNEKLSQIKPPFKDGLIFGFFASMNSRGVPACATFWLSLCSAFCALYFSLEVLGTIHKLRQPSFLLFLTHPLCQH